MARTLRNLDESVALIRKREEFTSRVRKTPYGTWTSMRGVKQDTGPRLHGMWSFLPNEYHESVGHATYVVYSYETPMAWWLERPAPGSPNEVIEAWLDNGQVGFWVMPSVSYSNTTNQHQQTIATAVDPGTTEEFVPYTYEGANGEGYYRRSGFTTEYRQLGWAYKHKYKNRGENANGPSVERHGW